MSSENRYASPLAEEPSPDGHYPRIGGWLILLFISLAITLVSGLFLLFRNMIRFGPIGMWSLPVLVGHSALLTAAAAAGLALMARRSRAFPRYMIGYLVGMLALAVGLLVLRGDASNWFMALGRATFESVVWIPYILLSKRVKETFVR